VATPPDGAVTPSCCLAHDLLNKLTAILAECELLQSEKPTPAASHRVHVIQDLARQLAANVVQHQCTMNEVFRSHVERIR
jgi:signal transduction histidine kinase